MGYNLLFKQAIDFHNNGDLDKAEHLYRQILEAAPNQPDVLNLLGLIAQSKNVHHEAINLFYKAIKEAPNHPPFHFNLAVSLDMWGKPFEAISSYMEVIKLNPDVVEAYNNIASIYMRLKEKEKAIEFYKKSLNIKENPEALANLAFINKNLEELEDISIKYDDEVAFYFLSILSEDDDKSFKYIKKAYEIAPFSIDIALRYANLCFLSGDIEKAKELYVDIIETNEFSDEAMINLANIYFKENKIEDARKLYLKAIDINKKNVHAYINYANLLYNQKEIHRALDMYREAVILAPELPEISNNIGIIQRDFKEYEEAAGLFFSALSINPDEEEFSVNLYETILIMKYENMEEKAIKFAENWLKAMPNNVFAKHIVASFKNEEIEDNTEYVKKLFDNFAKNYEQTLKRIDYKVLDFISSLKEEYKGKILDAGCGTGLLGERIKADDNYIVGIDVSQKMLDMIKSKNAYNQLINIDILKYLKEENDFDYIFALDVLGYISDVEEFIKLCKGKKLYFTIEILENSDKNYIVSEAGRYKHSMKYIDSLLMKYSFNNVDKHEIDIRIENLIPVKGIVYIAS